MAGRDVPAHAGGGRDHHLLLLPDICHAVVLVRAHRKHPDDLPEHVRGRTQVG